MNIGNPEKPAPKGGVLPLLGAAVIFAAAALLHLHRLVLHGEVPIDRDNLYFFYPLLTVFQWEGLPLWNPFELSGSSLAANPQAALFYPPNWILFFVPTDLGFAWTTWFHYLLGGTGMYLLTRSFRLRWSAGVLAGIGLLLGGYFQSRLCLRPLLLSAAWIPWVLWFFHRALLGRWNPWALLAGCAVALAFLPGMYHNGVYGILALFLFALTYAIRGRTGKAPRFIGLAFIAAFVGFLLASVSILPVAELLPHTVRTSFTYEAATASSVAPADLLRIFTGRPPTALADWTRLETAVYPGWTVLLLSVAAFLPIGRRKDRRPKTRDALFLAVGLLLVGVGLALGKHFVLHRLFYSLPGGRFFNNPSRALILSALAFPLLGAVGLEKALRVLDRRRALLGTIAGVALLPLLAADLCSYRSVLGLSFAEPNFERRPSTTEYIRTHADPGDRVQARDVLHTVGADLGWDRGRGMLTPKRSIIDEVECVSGYDPLHLSRYGGLVSRLAGLSPGEDPTRVVLPAEANPTLLDLLHVRYVVGNPLEERAFDDEISVGPGHKVPVPTQGASGPATGVRIHGFSSGALLFSDGETVALMEVVAETSPGRTGVWRLPIRTGIETADVLAAARRGECRHDASRAYRRWMDRVDGRPTVLQSYDGIIPFPTDATPTSFVVHNPGRGARFRLLGMAVQRPDDGAFRLVSRDSADRLRVYENLLLGPKARLLRRVRVASSPEEVLDLVASPDFSPDQVAIVEDALPEELDEKADPTGDAVEQMIYERGLRILSVRADSPALLVLSEVFYPGWKAELDGREVPIRPADYALQSIYIPAGSHKVVLRYRPRGFILGSALSCAGALVLLILTARAGLGAAGQPRCNQGG